MTKKDFSVGGLLHVERENSYQHVLEQMYTGEADFAALLIENGVLSEEVLEERMIAIAQSLGVPFLDEGETDISQHQRVQTIIPDPKMADEQVSSSSSNELYLHVENVGMEKMPDWVVIGCLRNKEKAQTTLVDPVKVFKELTPEQRKQLQEAKYYIQEPHSFVLTAGRQERKRIHERVSIFDDKHKTGRPIILADFEAMGSDSVPHKKAFEAFLDTAREQSLSVTLNPGSILVIRNTAINNGASPDSKRYVMALHGRKPFTPDWKDPRVLKRVFVRGN